jgi:ABC-type glycerol-3-phosphate transport system permease component
MASLSLINKHRFSWLLGRIVIYAVIGTGAVFILVPFVWQLSTALKTPEQIYIVPPQWIPDPIAWNNFIDGWTAMPFTRYFINTVTITGASLVAEILSSCIVAFAFARLQFRGKNVLFIILLSTMMLPGQVTMIPKYILFGKLHWVDTFLPLIVPGFTAVPFYVFLLRQFFMGIPTDLDDAARIDGCGYFRLFVNILLPLTKSALFAVGLMSFLRHWNDFMGPLIYLNSNNMRTLVIGLAYFVTSELEGLTQLPYLLAVNTIVMLPCILLFLAFQEQFIQGVVVTGVKG